ncbi:polyprenyl synthetase family protein [Streptomyces sp. 796.1]|uniref:polyprenyl synthetase family protein n=1 Tax=Streptomyces sp. 796.1 TaxID=3163029 RepID=UPI0039C98CD0
MPGTVSRTSAATAEDPTSARAELERLLGRVQGRLERLLAAERHEWQEHNPDALALVDAVAQIVFSGGKRLRPAFCAAGYLAAGGAPLAPAVVDVAAALEALHTFALLHDDVMDASELRRNKPTAHVTHAELHRREGWRGEPRRYGEGVAVLAGDLALTYANRLAAGAPPQVMEVWGELCTELMAGQYLDIRAAARFHPDPELARHIAVFKSGRYTISRPLALGALLAGAAADTLAAFEEYGLAVGEAFQFRDDLLDAFGDPGTTGKPGQLDLKQHKMTLLMSFALRDEPAVSDLVAGDLAGTDPDELYATLVRTGIRDRVESVIEERVKVACEAVRAADISPQWAAELSTMAHQAAYRDH